ALLQRLIRGRPAPDAASGRHDDPAGNAAARQPPIIDGEFHAVEETDAPPARLGVVARAAAASADAAGKAQPILAGLRGLLDRIKRRPGPGPHGLTQPAPVTAPDVVPAGGQF